MWTRFLLPLLACCACLAACGVLGRSAEPPPVAAAPAPATQRYADLTAYRLGVGDRVRVDVFGEPDLTVDAVIDSSGTLNYPLLGTVQAVRKTARQLQQSIASGLAKGYLVNPDVRVAIVQYRPFYVTGEVRKAGAYPFVIGLTVEKAVALAGGFTPLASDRKIYLLREDAAKEKRMKAELDDIVLPGDTLLVEQSLF